MDVVALKNAAGDVAIGVEIEGVFVSFVTVPAQRIAHYVERGQQLAERAKDEAHEGHEQAQKALEADFKGSKPNAAKRGAN